MMEVIMGVNFRDFHFLHEFLRLILVKNAPNLLTRCSRRTGQQQVSLPVLAKLSATQQAKTPMRL
jgi:hypothetical protein